MSVLNVSVEHRPQDSLPADRGRCRQPRQVEPQRYCTMTPAQQAAWAQLWGKLLAPGDTDMEKGNRHAGNVAAQATASGEGKPLADYNATTLDVSSQYLERWRCSCE